MLYTFWVIWPFFQYLTNDWHPNCRFLHPLGNVANNSNAAAVYCQKSAARDEGAPKIRIENYFGLRKSWCTNARRTPHLNILQGYSCLRCCQYLHFFHPQNPCKKLSTRKFKSGVLNKQKLFTLNLILWNNDGNDAFLQRFPSKFRWHNTLQNTHTVHNEYFNSVYPRDCDFGGRRESIIYGRDKLECALCMEIPCKIFLKKGVTVTPAGNLLLILSYYVFMSAYYKCGNYTLKSC